MLRRVGLQWLISTVVVAMAPACQSTTPEKSFGCTADQLAGWQIPAGWIDHQLSPADARVEVLTANLSKESMEARWSAMRDQWRTGDSYWLYRRPDDEKRNALGIQRGVVLIRGCRQLGFVTTRIETETVR